MAEVALRNVSKKLLQERQRHRAEVDTQRRAGKTAAAVAAAEKLLAVERSLFGSDQDEVPGG